MTDRHSEPFAELDEMLFALREAQLTDPQAARLEELVLADERARRRYLQMVELTTSLYWMNPREDEGGETDASPASLTATTGHRFSSALKALRTPRAASMLVATGVTCALLLVLGVLPVPRWNDGRIQPGSADAISAPIVARLTSADDCVWSSVIRPRLGVYLREGESLDLLRGQAEITFHDGAQVVLIGPAKFATTTPRAGYLERGKLRALVPKAARGFQIHSPSSIVTDRGTEFGVEVERNGATEVHVFTGSVQLQGADGGRAALVLKASEAARIELAEQRLVPIELDEPRFATLERPGRNVSVTTELPVAIQSYSYPGPLVPNEQADRSDPFHIKLTDGLRGSGSYTDGAWIGVIDSTMSDVPQPRIEFDLGETMPLTAVEIVYLVDRESAVHAPDLIRVSIATSSEAVFRQVAESHDFDDHDPIAGGNQGVVRSQRIELGGQPVRHLRIDVYNDREWTFLSEVLCFRPRSPAPQPATTIKQEAPSASF